MEYTITQAKKYLNAIVASQQTTIILKNGKPEAVLMSFEQYRNLSQEMIQLHEKVAVETARQIARGEMEEVLLEDYKAEEY